MWLLLLTMTAHANPDRMLGRVGDRLRLSTYATVEGDGPAFARWRRSSGSIRAWTFNDRQIERFVRYDNRQPAEAAWFNIPGDRVATAVYEDGEPTTFTVTWPAMDPVDVSDWQSQTKAGLTFPAPATGDDDRWPQGDGEVSVAMVLPGDPGEDAYRDALEVGCGCLVVDRNPAYIEGKSAVRFRLRLVHTGEPRFAETWVLPVEDSNLAFWAVWPESDPSALAVMRAMVSLATWEGS